MTFLASLSPRNPTNNACRSRLSGVHAANSISATSSGFSHLQTAISSFVTRSPCSEAAANTCAIYVDCFIHSLVPWNRHDSDATLAALLRAFAKTLPFEAK